jgi:hypothetical protein
MVQDHSGLTVALGNGCKKARGEFIGRHDANDVAHPGKYRSLLALIRGQRSTCLVSCGTRFLGPDGEFLYDVKFTSQQLRQGLSQPAPQRLRGPSHHGSTLFRRDRYHAVGGYRRPFYVAQDLDLWLRLSESGNVLATEEILYQAMITEHDISLLLRRHQLRMTRLIAQAAACRRAGEGEDKILAKAQRLTNAIQRSQRGKTGYSASARGLYFIGACLADNGDVSARRYLWDAAKKNPLLVRTWLKLMTTQSLRA